MSLWTINRRSQVAHYLRTGWSYRKGSAAFPVVLETKSPNGGMVMIPGKSKLHCLRRLWRHTANFRSVAS